MSPTCNGVSTIGRSINRRECLPRNVQVAHRVAISTVPSIASPRSVRRLIRRGTRTTQTRQMEERRLPRSSPAGARPGPNSRLTSWIGLDTERWHLPRSGPSAAPLAKTSAHAISPTVGCAIRIGSLQGSGARAIIAAARGRRRRVTPHHICIAVPQPQWLSPTGRSRHRRLSSF